MFAIFGMASVVVGVSVAYVAAVAKFTGMNDGS